MFESFYAAYGKNVWENCARIISAKSDQELQPYFMELLRWLEDRNWPGTELIFNRLLDVQELGLLPFAMNECTKEAYVMEEHIWLYNMAE